MSTRLDQEREKRLQPKRMAYTKEQIENLGLLPMPILTTKGATSVMLKANEKLNEIKSSITEFCEVKK